MGKLIKATVLGAKLTLAECTDGFWLYDDARGMNLSMRADTSTDALVEALEYYQGRLSEVESEYKELLSKVDKFIEQFAESDD